MIVTLFSDAKSAADANKSNSQIPAGIKRWFNPGNVFANCAIAVGPPFGIANVTFDGSKNGTGVSSGT